MATEKKDAALEAEVKEVTEEAAAEIKEEAEDVAAEVKEEAEEAAPVKVSSKRIKKAQRREAKAARKAANKIEEKKSRPNNALIAILIFGVVVGMFAFVLGYNYFSKPASIAKYIEDNGGAEAFGAMQIDAYTKANITADGNTMTIALTADIEDEAATKEIEDYYGGDDGKENLEYLTAYFLTSIKPQTRAFSAKASSTYTLNGKEINSAEMTFKEAKDLMEKEAKEAEEAADDAADDADEAADDADDAADAPDEAADDAANAADEAADDAADDAGEEDGE